MNKYTDLEALERLCILVEEAGVDIAPNFDQYTDMAFAIANALGEAGRDCFHRLCALCPKYQPVKADKLFTDAIAKGRGANGLGTVFYLAEQAGINLGDLKQFSRIPVPPSSFSPEGAGAHARTYYMQHTSTGIPYVRTNSRNSAKKGDFAPFSGEKRNMFRKTAGEQEETVEELPYEAQHKELPTAFPSYNWALFLQKILDCGLGEAQRDMLFCGIMAALGTTVSRMTYVHYANRKQYPCLQVFVIAPAASGKGAVSWVRQLVMPFHKEKIARYEASKTIYQKELNEWSNQGKSRDESLKPTPPKLELFFIAGNNSGTGIQENIIDNGGNGLIIEPEAEVLSTAIQAEYGQWSHLLRRAHDHEFLSYNRRKDHEYRECDCIRLGVVVCGTPGQLIKLIPGAENGLFSRQLFYYMPPLGEFIDMFPNENNADYEEMFQAWGKRWKKVIDALTSSVTSIEFKPTTSQRKRLINKMSQLFRHASVAHGDSMRSSVVRLAVNLLRITNIVALTRALDSLLTLDDEVALDARLQKITPTLLECPGISAATDTADENVRDGIVSKFVLEANDEDFDAVLELAEPFYRHAEHALMSLPQETTDERDMTPQERFLGELPMKFNRQQSLEIGEKFGFTAKQVEYYIGKLMDKGIVERSGRGTYSFVGGKRSSLDEENQESSGE